jgi:murein DD-endopeptidase MepM/ murein hydrolase activator NlpD
MATDSTSRGYLVLLVAVCILIVFQALAIGRDADGFEKPVLSVTTSFVTEGSLDAQVPIELAPTNFEPGALSQLPGEEESALGDATEDDDEDEGSETAPETSSVASPSTTALPTAPAVEAVAADAATGFGRHRVQSGESLWKVARRYGVTVDDLANWNLLTDRSTIRPGDELVVRTIPATTAPQTSAPTQATGESTGSTSLTYAVQSGDTLFLIAKKFRTSVASLLLNNSIPDPERLQPGQELVVTTANRILHVVNQGETLWELSKLYSVPLQDLIDHNNMTYSTIFPGQRLDIPVSDPRTLTSLFAHRRALKFGRPLRGRTTARFGWRVHPILARRLFHCGVDLAAPAGTDIGSVAPGTVTFAGWLRGYGKVVVVKHKSGLSSRYAHCQDLRVEVGDRVVAGQTLATVGTTGLSTGPHLHLEIRRWGRPIDPAEYITI